MGFFQGVAGVPFPPFSEFATFLSIMYLTQVIDECHLPFTLAYPYKTKRVNKVQDTKFKLFLSFFIQRPLGAVYQSPHVTS